MGVSMKRVSSTFAPRRSVPQRAPRALPPPMRLRASNHRTQTAQSAGIWHAIAMRTTDGARQQAVATVLSTRRTRLRGAPPSDRHAWFPGASGWARAQLKPSQRTWRAAGTYIAAGAERESTRQWNLWRGSCQHLRSAASASTLGAARPRNQVGARQVGCAANAVAPAVRFT